MSTKIKGITVEIGGNTLPLKKALKELDKNINSTQKELNEVNRLLKFDPKNTELLAQKQKLLADMVSLTEKKVSTLSGAKKTADNEMSKGTQINQEEYRKLQREIIASEGKIKAFSKSTGEATEKFSLFGKNGAVANELFIKSLDRINNVIGGLAKKLFGLAKQSGEYADEVLTVSAQTNLSTEAIQKYMYAAELVDVDVETITGSMAKLTKNMATASKGTGDAADAFKKLGVRITDNNGQLKSNQVVFNEVITKLGKMTNETQRDAYAMQIFGKSAQELNPLIKAGAEEFNRLGEEAEKAGAIMSEDALADAGAFDDAMIKLQQTLKAIGNSIGAELAKALTGLLAALAPIFAIVVDLLKVLGSIPAPVLIVIGTLLMIAPIILNILKAMTTINQFMTVMNPATIKTTIIILGVVAALIALAAAIAVLSGKGNDLQKTMKSIGEGVGGVKDIRMPRYANGTNYHQGGGAVITEYGAERLTLPSGAQYVVMPRGTKVDNAQKTATAMGGSTTTNYYNVSVQADNLQQAVDVYRLFESLPRTVKAGEVMG